MWWTPQFFPSSAGLNPSLTVAAKHVAGGRADIYSLAKHNRQSIRLRRDMIHIGECPRTVTNAVCSVGGVFGERGTNYAAQER
jgi:hypothetical protein